MPRSDPSSAPPRQMAPRCSTQSASCCQPNDPESQSPGLGEQLPGMWEAIPTILDRFEQNPSVRVIVLKGAGDQAFVSGADISQFEKVRSSRETNAHYDNVSGEASRRLITCSKPTIAMINGFCIGGGLAIAIGCDIRIAAENARFGIPAARLGGGYGSSGVKK